MVTVSWSAPESVAAAGFAPSATVTLPVAAVSRLPDWSRTETVTGESGRPRSFTAAGALKEMLVATGAAVTVSVSGALVTPWADAVICVVPAATPVATPVAELMVATPAALLAQVKVTPPMMLPLLSFAVAANCSVALAAMDGEAGVTAMVATTGLVERVFDPEEPPPQPD